MLDQTDFQFRTDVFWGGLPWEEIYSCRHSGRDDNVLPSHDRSYANPSLYPNLELLRKTAEAVFLETKKRVYDLEQKILGEQPKEKRILLATAQEIADGTFNGRIELEGNFSGQLGGDSDSRIEDIPDQLKQAQEEFGSEGYKQRIRSAEVVAVELTDMLTYTGLVMVAQGLRKMLNTGTFVPEVIGKYFHNTYQSLHQ